MSYCNQSPNISLIVAMSKNKIIGNDGKLPWPRLKEDMRFFRDMTIGGTVVMGRKTFESINNKPLPRRENVVVSSTLENSIFPANLWIIKDINKVFELRNPFIIGGRTLYEYFMPYATTIYATILWQDFYGDVKFPELVGNWDVSILEAHEEQGINYTIYKYKRN